MIEQHIAKTRVTFDDGTIESVDTIRHKDKLWLVPMWIERPALKQKMPLRLIRLDSLPYQNFGGKDFVLNNGMPRAIFEIEWTPPPEKNLEVLEKPEIWFAIHSVE